MPRGHARCRPRGYTFTHPTFQALSPFHHRHVGNNNNALPVLAHGHPLTALLRHLRRSGRGQFPIRTRKMSRLGDPHTVPRLPGFEHGRLSAELSLSGHVQTPRAAQTLAGVATAWRWSHFPPRPAGAPGMSRSAAGSVHPRPAGTHARDRWWGCARRLRSWNWRATCWGGNRGLREGRLARSDVLKDSPTVAAGTAITVPGGSTVGEHGSAQQLVLPASSEGEQHGEAAGRGGASVGTGWCGTSGPGVGSLRAGLGKSADSGGSAGA